MINDLLNDAHRSELLRAAQIEQRRRQYVRDAATVTFDETTPEQGPHPRLRIGLFRRLARRAITTQTTPAVAGC
jgi:hypothetical protein